MEAINMILHCPECGTQHVDAPEPENGWTNPPHKSHLCHGCGIIWRPADVPTNGVATINTRGDADTYPNPDGIASGFTRLRTTLERIAKRNASQERAASAFYKSKHEAKEALKTR